MLSNMEAAMINPQETLEVRLARLEEQSKNMNTGLDKIGKSLELLPSMAINIESLTEDNKAIKKDIDSLKNFRMRLITLCAALAGSFGYFGSKFNDLL